MRTLSKILLGIAAASAVTGCSWAAFDDLADETWVDRAGAPSGVASNLYGEQVAASGVRGDGASFLVLGRNNASVGKISYDANGVRTQIDAGSLGSYDFAGFQEHPAIAGDALSTKVGFAVVTLTGTDPNSNTKFIVFEVGGPFAGAQFEAPPVLKGAKTVNGMEFTDVDNDTKRDIIAARKDQAVVVTDWASFSGGGSFAFTACNHGEQDSYAITSADLDGDNIPEIVLAAGDESRTGSSSVFIFEPSAATQYDGSAGAAPGSCFTTPALNTLTKTSISVHDLGAQLGFVDEGMGQWLVATSPLSNQLFVFQNPLAADGTDLVVQSPPGAGAFGESLAIGDLNGDGKPELVVGAPKTTVNGQANAGAVYIYQYNGTTFADPIELHDSSPEAEQHFGKSVAVVPFGADDAMVVAGADGETFAYFKTKLYLDVRAGHQ